MSTPQARRLTLKQRGFVKEYISNGGNGTQAALQIYNTDDPNEAKVIASQNLTKLNISERIEQSLLKNGLTTDQITGNLGHYANKLAENVSADASIKANIELLKIMGAYPGSKHTNLNLSLKGDINKMSYSEAKDTLKKLRDTNSGLLQDTEEDTITPTDTI